MDPCPLSSSASGCGWRACWLSSWPGSGPSARTFAVDRTTVARISPQKHVEVGRTGPAQGRIRSRSETENSNHYEDADEDADGTIFESLFANPRRFREPTA